jgi:SNF2 family DNA or RNA helicase
VRHFPFLNFLLIYLAENHTSFGCGTGFPDLPFLIVAPKTLVTQWVSELRRFFQKGSIDVFEYVGSTRSRANFFSDNGVWAASKQPFGRRVIVASHPVCRFP